MRNGLKMHILTIDGREDEGAYSVTDELGEKILYIWEEEDDAVRFAMMLEEEGYPEMSVVGLAKCMTIRIQ